LLWRKANLGVFDARKWHVVVGVATSSRTRRLQLKVAVKLRLQEVLLRLTNRLERAEDEAKVIPAVEQACAATKALFELNEADLEKANRETEIEFQLALLGDDITPESCLRAVEVIDRLDALIDRAVKRLCQLKAMKETLGLRPVA
jgi:hypothetical protein